MRDSDLLGKINDGVFFEKIFGPERDWDAALDARDAIAFDTAWRESCDKLPQDDAATATAPVREAAFKAVFRLTGNPDLAVYVSDDFGLIAQARLQAADIAFIDSLWDCYARGEFPA